MFPLLVLRAELIQYRQGTAAVIRRSVFREIRLQRRRQLPSSELEYVVQQRGRRAGEFGLVPPGRRLVPLDSMFGFFTARAPSAGNLVRSRPLDTLIVVKFCHAVFVPLYTWQTQGLVAVVGVRRRTPQPDRE